MENCRVLQAATILVALVTRRTFWLLNLQHNSSILQIVFGSLTETVKHLRSINCCVVFINYPVCSEL